MKRKIVQIAATADSDVLFALADDGTLWRQLVGSDDWIPIFPLPDADEEEDR